MQVSSGPLIILILPALLAMLGALVFLILRRRRGASVDVPSCRKCLYAVVGLDGHVCPECGSDLTVVGIIEPDHVKPMSALTRVMVWTCLIGLPLVVGSVAIIENAPPVVVFTQRAMLGSPNSRAYQSVVISSPSTGGLPVSAAGQDLEVALVDSDGSLHTLHATPGHDEITYKDASGRFIRANGPLTQGVLGEWFQDLGYDISDDRIASEVARIAENIPRINGQPLASPTRVMAGSSGFSSSSATSSMRSIPRPHLERNTLVGSFVVWLLGIVVIIALARRRM